MARLAGARLGQARSGKVNGPAWRRLARQGAAPHGPARFGQVGLGPAGQGRLLVRVLAEAGQCAMGSPTVAIQMAREAKAAGAWGIKFQVLEPKTIASPDAPKYWHDEIGTRDQREAFQRAGIIPRSSWKQVADACRDLELEFIATPFDLPAVDLLVGVGCRFIKLASGDITHRPLIEHVAATGKTIILSTGASYHQEIARALEWCGGVPVILLACNLAYPTKAEDANLARLETLRHCFPQCEVGWSDHTSLASAGLAAGALGSTMNEVHFTLDRSAPDVPDHQMALDPVGLAEYVVCSHLGERLRGSLALAPNDSEAAARGGARRSVCAARDLPEGHTITADDLICLRPGDGIPPYHLDALVGQQTKRPIPEGTQV